MPKEQFLTKDLLVGWIEESEGCCGIGVAGEFRIGHRDGELKFTIPEEYILTDEQKVALIDRWEDKVRPYGVLLASTNSSQLVVADILKRTGWSSYHRFTNPKTGNDVTMWMYENSTATAGA